MTGIALSCDVERSVFVLLVLFIETFEEDTELLSDLVFIVWHLKDLAFGETCADRLINKDEISFVIPGVLVDHKLSLNNVVRSVFK